jgi:hypothetical protein
VAAAQLARPGLVPPLYDGVVVVEPYRWVDPPSGAAGEPRSFAGSEAVQDGTSPAFAASTPEAPPQAQLLAPAAAFAVPVTATELEVAIDPIAPPAGASIAGNAYRFSVTLRGGAVVPVGPGGLVTIALRAPTGTDEARIVRLDATGAAETVTTEASGQADGYLATVDALGTFAVAGTPGSARSDEVVATVGILVAAGLGGLILLWVRQRRGRHHAHVRPTRPDAPRGRR